MKKFSLMAGLLLLMAITILQGCKKDKDKDDPGDDSLVMVKRSTGVMYTVNSSTGSMTELMTLKYNGMPLTGLRGLVYDPATDKCYAGATNQGGGYFYSIDLATGEATLLNDNSEDDWDAIADLIIAPDNNIMAVIYSNIEYNSALAIFNKSTGVSGTHKTIYYVAEDDDLWSPGALTYGSSQSQLIIGGYNSIYVSNLDGAVSAIIPIGTTANIDDDEIYVMDMEKVGSTVYALVYEYNDEDQYLVKINTSTGTITEIKNIASGSNSNLYHCLAFIPEDKL